MGLFDSVVGALSGAQSGGGNSLMNVVMQLINDPQNGGLGGLLKTFEQGGLGDVVKSWVASGQNLPISADQLQAVLGSGKLQEIAAQLGISPEQASTSLAEMLPKVVDHLTPNGQLPEGGNLLAEGMDLLKKSGLFA